MNKFVKSYTHQCIQTLFFTLPCGSYSSSHMLSPGGTTVHHELSPFMTVKFDYIYRNDITLFGDIKQNCSGIAISMLSSSAQGNATFRPVML